MNNVPKSVYVYPTLPPQQQQPLVHHVHLYTGIGVPVTVKRTQLRWHLIAVVVVVVCGVDIKRRKPQPLIGAIANVLWFVQLLK